MTSLKACLYAIWIVAAVTVIARGDEGFDLLRRAAEEAPRDVPKSDASLSDIGTFVKRGEPSWATCQMALNEKVAIPADIDVVEVAEFRPLFRLLQWRAIYAMRNADSGAAQATIAAFLKVAEAFCSGVGAAGRDGGFIADLYLAEVLEQASSSLDQPACKRITRAMRDYMRTWEPPGAVFARTLQRDRQKIGDQAVEALRRAGEQRKARAALDSKTKLHRTVYDLFAVKFAIRDFMLKHGQPPDSLEKLDGVEVTDPYAADAAPFRYHRDGERFTLYSLGPDGYDDNGTGRKWSELLGGAKGDLVP